MTRRVATYVRVSTAGQTTENQTLELRAVCERRGWQITKEFSDNGISGSKSRDHRPGFDALWRAVTNREIDVVAVWALDRLGRSMFELVKFGTDLRSAGSVDLYVHTQGIDTSTPEGRMFFHMIGAFAEFELEMIKGRVNAGMARAKEIGTKSGRPIGRPVVAAEDDVRAMLAHGESVSTIRDALGVGSSVVTRLRAEMGLSPASAPARLPAAPEPAA